MGSDINSFVESMIMGPKSKAPKSNDAPEVAYKSKDISKVKVPDGFINSIINEEYWVDPKTEKKNTDSNETSEIGSLLEEISNIKKEITALYAKFEEMTTCGHIGMNLAGNAETEEPGKPKNKVKLLDSNKKIKIRRKTV